MKLETVLPLLLTAQVVFGSREPTLRGHSQMRVGDTWINVSVATFYFEYSLFPGQNLFTLPENTFVPSFDQPFALLAQRGVRNLHQGTNISVSLDEVYVHHLSFFPGWMIGAEQLTASSEDIASGASQKSQFTFQPGYGYILNASKIGINAHLLSNVDLAPINGSLALAHKQCNECYYAPGKGSECTPEMEGTFSCCGDSEVCRSGKEQCACKTNTGSTTPIRYEVQMDFLVTFEVEHITPLANWALTAPQCAMGVTRYAANSPCAISQTTTKTGSLFHQIYRNDTNPEQETTGTWVSPYSGTIHYAQAHLHTGGVNLTFSINGQNICTSNAEYGTNPNNETNARDEFGHLIAITDCISQGTRVRVEKGDVLHLSSYYYAGMDDSRLPNKAGGEHLNVMSFMFFGFEIDGANTKGQNSFMDMFNVYV